MKLHKITIQNFRSILNEELEINSNCIGLIGLNESGKSNVLNAIKLVDERFRPSQKDISKITKKFPSANFHFKLEDHEVAEFKKQAENYFTTSIEPEGSVQVQIADVDGLIVSVKFEQANQSTKRSVDINFPFKVKFRGNILARIKDAKIPEGTVVPMTYEDGTSDNVPLDSIEYAAASIVREDLLKYFEPLDEDVLKRELVAELSERLLERLPQVIFWEYQEQYLLPSEITYDDFIKDDDPYKNSIPLYNILLLSTLLEHGSLEELKDKIAAWRNDSSQRRKDSRIITERVNTYIKGIWSDYDQELNVELEETKITIHINDPRSSQKNYYEMEARSQGFKTFISFILTIAADVENEFVSNFILLLDEPETHLHPSGVRYMRDELLKLSDKGNYIFFATHSIFMIDRLNLPRHIIVSKENELTKLTKVERNNFLQEAVMYEAMGTQIDEFSIGAKNIVFEGGLDLKLFDFVINKCHENKGVVKQIQDFDQWNGGGTKKIESFFTSKILPKNSEWIIILDNDSPAQILARNLDARFKDSPHNNVSCYHYSNVPNQELEDILPKKFIESAINNAISELNVNTPFPVNLDLPKTISSIVAEFKSKNSFNTEQNNLFEQQFKKNLEEIVSEELSRIETEMTSKRDRTDEFKMVFDRYYKFIDDFLGKNESKQ